MQTGLERSPPILKAIGVGYTVFDVWLARVRFLAAFPHIRANARVCDIGCGVDAQFLRWAHTRIGFGVGVDIQNFSKKAIPVRIVRANITQSLPLCDGVFDHATMLAVLEHLREPEVTLREAFRILAPGGSLILTWPNEAVDPFLKVLHRARVFSDEMEGEKHQRRLPLDQLSALLRAIGFERLVHRTFEFGLNNLLVAHKHGADRRGR